MAFLTPGTFAFKNIDRKFIRENPSFESTERACEVQIQRF